MTVAQIISYLRLNVKIQDPDAAALDPVYLSMTDEDILLFLNVALTRDFPKIVSLDYLPTEDIYPLVLLTRKDLYFSLASVAAPLFDINADQNNQLKREQRFNHYMNLIVEVDKEYNQYNEDGGAGTHNTLTSYDVLLTNRFATLRNKEKGVVPALSVYLGAVTDSSIELSWAVQISRFFNYRVYVSTTPILDLYNVSNPISPDATLVITIRDIHQNKCRIENLLPNTEYYILVSATDLTLLTGYSEVVVSTLPLV